jgi:putative sporulation protein YtaF
MILSIVLLSISLSLDAFGIGIIYELRKIRIPLMSKIIISFFSVLYASIALFVGNSLSTLLSPTFSKFLGIIILVSIGLMMIFQSLGTEQSACQNKLKKLPESRTLIKIVIKSLGLSIHVIRNPIDGDLDNSGTIDKKESILLGFALSLDAIGVVIGSTLSGFSSKLIPIAVGVSQLIFIYLGTFVGRKLSEKTNINKKLISLLPGIMLIILGLIRI